MAKNAYTLGYATVYNIFLCQKLSIMHELVTCMLGSGGCCSDEKQ